MKRYWDKNLGLLKTKNPGLYERVIRHQPESIGEIIPTRTVPTLRFTGPGEKFAYPWEDPLLALQSNNQIPILNSEKSLGRTICVFTGMGLGYIPLIVAVRREDLFKAVILEPCLDLFVLALQYVDLSVLLTSDRVQILAGNIDWSEFDTIINNQKFEAQFEFCDHPFLFDWQRELYERTKYRAAGYVHHAASASGVLTQFGSRLFKNRISNLTLFRESCPADALAGAFRGKPVILVSAGPSLGQSMHLLKEAVGKAVIIAVDSAVVPLLNHGITPDFVTTLDFRPLNSEKLSPDLIRQQNFFLVVNIFASDLVAKRLDVPCLFFSFQENDTQEWLMNHLNVKHKMPPVNSVPLLSFAFARMIQADPVIFLGHDFALTSKQTDHAGGAVFSHGWHKRKDLIQVPGVGGRPVDTFEALFMFKQNLEELIEQYPADYINATASGAHIKGTRVKDLARVIKENLNEDIPVRQIVDECAPKMNGGNVRSLIQAARKQIAAAEKTHKQIKSVMGHNRKVKNFVRKNSQSAVPGFSGLPKPVQTALKKREEQRSQFEPFIPMEEIAAKYVQKARAILRTEKGSSHLEQIGIDARAVELEMEGHHQGLLEFKRQVGNLVAYLEKEDRILGRVKQEKYSQKDLIELAGMFLGTNNSKGAFKILEKCLNEFEPSPAVLMLMGECRAQLLDFEGAFIYWDSALKRSPVLEKSIKNKRREMAEYWIQRGKEEPMIFPACLKRAFALCREKEFLRQHRQDIWPVTRSWIGRFLKDDKDDAARNLIRLWEPLKEEIPGWDDLHEKCLVMG